MARGRGPRRGRTTRNPLHSHPHRHPRGGGPSTHRHHPELPGDAQDLGDCPGGFYDCNGICNGDSALDCDGNCFPAYHFMAYQGDGQCNDGTNGINLNCPEFDFDDGDCGDSDCDGIPGGNNVESDCGCIGPEAGNEGNGDWCDDCTGVPNGENVESDCGCIGPEAGNEGNGDWCDDCDGVPNGNSELDCLGVCNGDSALDCDEVCYDAYYYVAYLGDGHCNDGTNGINLNCPEFDNDGGDCDAGTDCSGNYEPDCDGVCYDAYYYVAYLGDGHCNDGTNGINLNCPEFDFDDGDCAGGGRDRVVSGGGRQRGGRMRKGGRVRRQMGGAPKPWR